MREPHGRRMKMLAKPVICACLAAITLSATGFAHPLRDHNQDRQATRQSQTLSVREIERRVVPKVPGAQYLGFDYDPGMEVYTLKFLRNGQVIWVTVEGSTGDIIKRSDR